MCSEVHQWRDAHFGTTAFKNEVFPQPAQWQARHYGDVVGFIRGGMDGWEGVPYVAHGTPLSILYKILRTGIRVGPSKHGETHGWFCIEGGYERDRIKHARDRSKAYMCEEFQLLKFPSGWTVPTVLAWEPWPGTHANHLKGFQDGCWKSCIPAKIGTVRPMPHKCAVFVNAAELDKYIQLQRLRPRKELYMLCGGKSSLKDKCVDPLHWAKDSNNMAPTCGNVVKISEMREDGGWSRKDSGCWFCASCNGNRCRSVYWSDTLRQPFVFGLRT